jgi:hypothetical protein
MRHQLHELHAWHQGLQHRGIDGAADSSAHLLKVDTAAAAAIDNAHHLFNHRARRWQAMENV